MAGRALDPELTDFAAIEDKIKRALENSRGANETVQAARIVEVLVNGPSPETRLFTADEVLTLVGAVAQAEREVSGATVMAHIQGAKSMDKQTAEAVRKIVVAAYIELLVGKV